MNNIVEILRKELENISSEEVRSSGQKFFKEEISSYGVKSADVA